MKPCQSSCLLKICLKPNICLYEGEVYQFPDDVGMLIGSTLGSLLGELFMHRLEREAMQPNIFTCSHIVRYVDDVLCLWTGGFLAHLNNLYLSIKFSLEIGEDSIPFLDVRVTLHHGSHKFEVYRKPTTNHLSVSNESFCHPRNKISGPSSMIHRLVSLPLEPPAFHKELSTIKYLAGRNRNGKINIDRMVQRKLMVLSLDPFAPHAVNCFNLQLSSSSS